MSQLQYFCYTLLFQLCFGDQPLMGPLSVFDYRPDPCLSECECYDWETVDSVGALDKRFVANCIGMKFGLFQSTDHIPKDLPLNTTDLIVSEYLLGTLSMKSFPNFFPMFLSVSLKGCHINYLASDTFQGNSFTAIKNITISGNNFDLLAEGTFKHLPNIENISIDSNFLQKIEREAFWNLPQVRAINLSHNSIKEIQQGAFDNLPLLEVLDLSGNWLMFIPGKDIASLPSLKLLKLGYNKWNCSCEMSWILKFSSILVDSGEAVCWYPVTLKSTTLQQLTTQDFQHCITSDSSYVLDLQNFGVCVGIIIICASFFLRGKIHIGQIEFDPKDTLGSGNRGNVFKGKFGDGRSVAIKRYPQLCNPEELDILLHLSRDGPPHRNVVQYLCVERDSDYTYIVLKLCGGNLKTAISDRRFLPFLTPECCLLQIARGVEFLHGKNIQHRDIKPQNILWSFSDKEVRFSISDFDISRFIENETSHKVMRGTEGWSASELWNKKGRRTTAVDILPLGCIFYYVLTRGRHPFGSISNMELCQQNIDDGVFSLGSLDELHDNFVAALADDLIIQMIALDASARPDAENILKHPLFWGESDMVDFYHRVGRYMRDMDDPSVQRLKENLERNAAAVFQGNWKDGLDKLVRSDLKSFKEHDKICTLLKVVRNKLEHYGDLGEKAKRVYQQSGGVVTYYNSHFPKLLAYAFHVEQEWEKSKVFAGQPQ